ncbi:MAG: type II secretion system protein GspE [Desulfuromonas sp.]|nr:MAG: type II secretion system protein GspE [Desulfuromonas sp.]
MSWKLLGEILQDDFDVAAAAIDNALVSQQANPEPLGKILRREIALPETTLAQALAIQQGLTFLESIPADSDNEELLQKMPISYVREHLIYPLAISEDNLELALADPGRDEVINDLAALYQRPLQLYVATEGEIRQAINRHFEKHSEQADKVMVDIGATNEQDTSLEASDLIDSSDEAPIIRFVNSLLTQAYKQKASDIHIEPAEGSLFVRYRIDGILHEVLQPPIKAHSAIVSRIKILSHLDIAEKRLPQDGRFDVQIAGKKIDIRVSVLPTDLGERVVLRLLDRSDDLLSLEELGLADKSLKSVESMISKSHGIFLVTGPTGSGKTTTLYAGLIRLNDREKNIITVEDPVEYRLAGVGQIQVNPRIDLTFAAGLRSTLRQDPDIIMVGEIRDAETATIAVQSALTGHMVFSTLHTNDAASALTRLVEMGVEPFLAASSIVGILAQRLVRKVCADCAEDYKPDRQLIREAGLADLIPATATLKRGIGCEKCHGSGYRGRVGIFELLTMTDSIREMLQAKNDAAAIRKKAIEEGMTPLRESGIKRILAGETTLEEVLRVTQEET